ncbi:MAG: hypothetical protein IJP13_00775 [Lachnospiraceae bacterium]|nr:hypothetical protein [Lachnospiraceae bacterium]
MDLYMVSDVRGEIERGKAKLNEAKTLLVKNRDSVNASLEKKHELEYAIHDMNVEMDRLNKALSDNIDTKTRLSEVESKAK